MSVGKIGRRAAVVGLSALTLAGCVPFVGLPSKKKSAKTSPTAREEDTYEPETEEPEEDTRQREESSASRDADLRATFDYGSQNVLDEERADWAAGFDEVAKERGRKAAIAAANFDYTLTPDSDWYPDIIQTKHELENKCKSLIESYQNSSGTNLAPQCQIIAGSEYMQGSSPHLCRMMVWVVRWLGEPGSKVPSDRANAQPKDPCTQQIAVDYVLSGGQWLVQISKQNHEMF